MSALSEWFAVDIIVAADAAEAVESAFSQTNCRGIETDIWKKPAGEPLRISGFFDQLPDLTDIEFAVRTGLDLYGLPADELKSISHRTIEQTDWLAEWKKHWKPVEVGRFVVAPPWAQIRETGKHIIRIEPNMAFGTGTHDTTQLCLKAISELVEPGDSLLDVGTGTGILAIAAAKLGADPVVACDIDEDSIKIARENAIANNVGDKISFVRGSIGEPTPMFDLVYANLTLDVIVPLLPLLFAKTGRSLLLSGILAEQQHEIANHLLRSEIADRKFEIAGEWLSVLIKK